MVNNPSIDDIFNKWVGVLRQDQDDRYTHKARPTFLGWLFADLIKYKIPYEDAKLLKRQVFNALITDEGKKGKGRHKGWPEAVNSDFDAILADMYIEGATDEEREEMLDKRQLSKAPEIAHVSSHETCIPYDLRIREWCLKTFPGCTEGIVTEAHRVGSILNMQFLEHVFVV